MNGRVRFRIAASFALSMLCAPVPAQYGAPSAAQAPAKGSAAPVVKEGTTVRISDHVFLIPDEKVGMVPNVGIIVGSKGTLVYDPGMGRQSGEIVLREVKKVAKGTELYIVNSHFHPEHTTGELAFPAGTRLLRAAAQQQDVEEMGMKWVSSFASRSPVIAGVLEGFTEFRKPTEIFEKERTLDLGGVRVRILRLGPGHTRGDTVLFVEGDRVLFSGDLAMKDLFPAFATPQSSGRTWLTSLDEMDKFKAKTVIGAHYPVADASVISDYRNYLRTLTARVAELKKEGKSAEDIGVQLRGEFAKKHPGWAQPQRVQQAATVLYREAE
jgi:glyoxylase-like metal-dependent hydrolase (beta-lactamase superfamily II)